jgi:hypothetical protein
MSRLFGFLVVIAITGTLMIGSANAGPGGPSHTGDPEIPNSSYLWNDFDPVIPSDRVEHKVPAWTFEEKVQQSWLSRIAQISLKLAWLFPR